MQTYSHFREALQSWKKADRSRAIEFLTQAVQIDPSIPYLFFMRGHLYQLQYQEEILNKDSIKENKERDSIVHRKALEDFDRAILGNENFLPAYLYRAQMRIAVGDYTGALADAERLTRSDPNWHEALFIQGVSMNQLKPRSGCQLLMRSRALGHGLSGIRYMEDCARFNPPPLAEQVRGIAYTPMQTVCMDAWLCMTLPGNWNYRREEKAAEKKITFRALQMAPGLVHVVSVDIYQENTETFDSFFEKVRKTDFLKGETRDAAAFIPANLSNVSRSAYVTGKHPELSGNAGVFLAAVKDRPAFIKISIFRELIKTPQDVEFPAMEALFILMYEKFILDSIFVLPEIHSQILRERSTGL
ncbi:MAG: hypothetical protein HS115_01955 [Spirochaetales bacterium]|nr:hypothetical protein [Spirochaetales bacterium]